MSRIVAICAAGFLLLQLSCRDFGASPGTITVHVFENVTVSVPGIKVLLVETGDILYTDSSGNAVFTVIPGSYTLRLFNIGTPGPGRPFVDVPVTVGDGENVRVSVFDCRLCV